jgi:RHS repeat-associated protein
VRTLSPFPHGTNTQAWTTNTQQGQVLAQVFRYDQLHRLKEARGIEGLTGANTWNGVVDATANRYKSAYAYDANGNIRTADRWDQTGTTPYDALTYKYNGSDPNAGVEKTTRNRLYELYDGGTDLTDDIHAADDTEPLDPLINGENLNVTTNYRYDQLGNLTHDTREEIQNIEWTVAGKVKSIERTTGSTREPLSFGYGASGQRTVKQVGTDPNGGTGYREYYIRDAQGNIMATYRYTNTQALGTSLKLTDRPMYGSGRLGSYVREKEMRGLDLLTPPTVLSTPHIPIQAAKEHYELTDHLGNVTAVVTGELLPGNGASQWQPKLITAQGYEPFGSLMPGRNYSSSSYNYGFNGKPKDDEVHGAEGTSYDYGLRMYDPRVARFLSLDPLGAGYPWYTPYQYAGNNPVKYVDVDGAEQGEILPGTNTMIIVIQGWGGASPPDGSTQAQNAVKTISGAGPDTGLGKTSDITYSMPGAQVLTYTPSRTGNTVSDVYNTIICLKDQCPDANVVLVGHSLGASNMIDVLKQTKKAGVVVDLAIFVDISAGGIGGYGPLYSSRYVPDGSVNNVINYYQDPNAKLQLGNIDPDDPPTLHGANIRVPGVDHTNIDNTMAPLIREDIMRFQCGAEDCVNSARSRDMSNVRPVANERSGGGSTPSY